MEYKFQKGDPVTCFPGLAGVILADGFKNSKDRIIYLVGFENGANENWHEDNLALRIDPPKMDPLTPEQIEYVKLKTAMENMGKEVERLQAAGLISSCLPLASPEYIAPLQMQDVEYTVELHFYAYMESLILQHQNRNEPIV